MNGRHNCTTRFVLFTIAVVSMLSRVTSAEDQPDALTRDAKRLVDCTKMFDAQCVIALSDLWSYKLLRGPTFGPTDLVPKRDAMKWLSFEITPTHSVFNDGSRNYAFVPYAAAFQKDRRVFMTRGFFVALSRDGGNSWQFVDGAGLTTDEIHRIVPSYADQPLPEVMFVDGGNPD